MAVVAIGDSTILHFTFYVLHLTGKPPGVRVNVGRYANRVLSFSRKPEIRCDFPEGATERRRGKVSRVTKYRHGGTTTSSHPFCPARVLLHGRCPKGCPERLVHSNCAIANLVDHPRLENTSTGEDCFVSSVYYAEVTDTEEYKRLKAVCDFHNLHVCVEEYPWNGQNIVSHVKITRQGSRGPRTGG